MELSEVFMVARIEKLGGIFITCSFKKLISVFSTNLLVAFLRCSISVNPLVSSLVIFPILFFTPLPNMIFINLSNSISEIFI